MEHRIYYPIMWLVIAALVVGILVVTSALSYYRRQLGNNETLQQIGFRELAFIKGVRWTLWFLASVLTAAGVGAWYWDHNRQKASIEARRAKLIPAYDPKKLWEAPDPFLAETDEEADLIAYGRRLIANTQDYFGEKGIVRPGTINALNCQNCHLDAGTKPFGNNYFAVASTYPQFRARSGSIETIPKRINDCFERSLNGQPLDTNSREMKAIVAYMRWLGTGVPKGEKPYGAGLVQVPFLDRAADPAKGRVVYETKCASCHGPDGQGLPIPGSERRYPPLWGERSYNQAAGLFRLSRFAGYVKANMPLGASHQNPQLTDEEAWDVAAFVNSMPRPAHPFLDTDWPDIATKPFDHPFGPYADPFPETQHKYGPFKPIVDFYKQKAQQKEKGGRLTAR
ncbi:MAG: c-type cytochrome [Saprospiraceae bacterium]|nr:c-type cytochrome [Saprospiraceae bacterium]MDW8484698.1 c-type cytochrome [Saprospiraceae bacterium]